MTALRADLPHDIPPTHPAPLVLHRQLLTCREAGARLGCSESTVRRLIRDGHLRSVKPPRLGRRVRPADLDEYVASLVTL
jgi:excisionase family DNA binding protein